MVVGLPQLVRHSTGDRVFELLQERIIEVLRPLVENPLLDGALIEAVELQAGDNKIAHTLDRSWRGFIICDRGAFSLVRSNQGAEDPTKWIVLSAASADTVSVWVF
jgi:hypothetical protein